MTAGAMALAVATLLIAALLKSRNDAPAAAYDLRVYRDQLAEIDRDLARGVIGSEEAARLRTEVSRRVLDADRALTNATEPDAPASFGRLAIALTAAITVFGTLSLYAWLGVPGYPDMPLSARIAMAENLRQHRPSQATAEAQTPATPRTDVDANMLELMDKLRAAVATRPGDLQGQDLLARNESALGNYGAATRAQAQIMTIKADTATAADFATQSEYMILAAGGYVSPEAEKALTEALHRDPNNGLAQYYFGLMYAQIGRPDMGFQLWNTLLQNSSDKDPWFVPLQSQIVDLARQAGVHYTPTAAAVMPGPAADDIAAAGEMSAEDRQAMIEGMVAQLSDRLNSTGGSAEEWARLIGAYSVLGKADTAKAAWAKAQVAFANTPDDLATVRAAAVAAGVSQ